MTFFLPPCIKGLIHAIHIICKIPTRKISDICKSVIKNFLKLATIIFAPLRFGWNLLRFKWYRGLKFWCFIIYRFSDSRSSCNAVFTSCAFSFNLSPLGKISDIIALQPFSLHFFCQIHNITCDSYWFYCRS